MRLCAILIILLPALGTAQVDKRYLTDSHIAQRWQVSKVTVDGKEVVLPNMEQVLQKTMHFKEDHSVVISGPAGNTAGSWKLDAVNKLLTIYTATSTHSYAILAVGEKELVIKQLPDQPAIHMTPVVKNKR